MAKYDQGGGCACGLMRVCDCDNNRQSDGSNAREPERRVITDVPTAASRPGFNSWALSLAVAVAGRSRDPSTKVGAVILRPDKSICSMGYNGFPRSMEDRPEWYDDRPEKYDRVIHAEMNAILQAKEPVNGYTIYCTHPPCKDCAKHMAAAGLTTAVWFDNEDIKARFDTTRSKIILVDCGITVVEVEDVRDRHDATEGRQELEVATWETS